MVAIIRSRISSSIVPSPRAKLLLSVSLASSSGIRGQADVSCGSTRRILTPAHFFHQLRDTTKYLVQADTIFKAMASPKDNVCGGGIYWQNNKEGPDGNPPYKNSIANELFLAVAAGLYVRLTTGPAGPNTQSYLDQANDTWNWFQQSGLINRSNHLVNDSFAKTNTGWSCTNDESTDVWTYTQGVILGWLCELYHANQQQQLVSKARPELRWTRSSRQRSGDRKVGNPAQVCISLC
jgi:hypothetical protein